MDYRLKTWLASKQEYLPILILINPKFGLNEGLFAGGCRKYWPNLKHFSNKIPHFDTLNELVLSKKRVIITTHSLEFLIKKGDFVQMLEEDIEYLAQKLLIIDDFKLPRNESEVILAIFDLLNETKNEEIECKPYSNNLKDYVLTFKDPEYFINELFRIFKWDEHQDFPVQILKDEYFINPDLLIKDFESIFGIQSPFDPLVIKRWVWDRSKSYNFRRNTDGKRYRKLTTWLPNLDL